MLNDKIKDQLKNNNLNVIRFVAALMVVWGHMEALLCLPSYTIFNMSTSTIGVKIFFVISGYLIYKSYMRDRNVLRYALRRIGRIMPALIIMLLITTFLIAPFLSNIGKKAYFESPVTYNYLWNMLLNVRYILPGVFESNPYPNAVNGSLWTLPIEMFLYVILPLIILLTKKIKGGKVGICVVFFIVFICRIIKYEKFPDARCVVYGTNIMDAIAIVPYFFIGCIFAFEEMEKILNLQISTFIIMVSACINLSYTLSECLLTFTLPYFIFSFAFEKKPVFAKIFAKNDYSYGLYLYSYFVQQVVIGFLYDKINLGVNEYAIICTVLSMVFAVFSWHLVEKPASSVIKKVIIKLQEKE